MPEEQANGTPLLEMSKVYVWRLPQPPRASCPQPPALRPERFVIRPPFFVLRLPPSSLRFQVSSFAPTRFAPCCVRLFALAKLSF